MACGQPEPVGQVVFDNTTTTNQITTTWIVPPRVTEIWAVCIGGNSVNSSSSIWRSGTCLLGSQLGFSSSFGGGLGGTGNTVAFSAGGAAGYSGNGGNGGTSPVSGGSAGNGGGGGGGAGGSGSNAGHGGGTGLVGEGANGAGGVTSGNRGGGDGSVDAGQTPYGAGYGRNSSSGVLRGSDLRYTIVPIPVTPGESLSIRIKGLAASGAMPKTGGAVRIIWGGGRSYPNNAGDLPEVL